MATKRTKPESPVAKAAKPAPKRKMAVGPPSSEATAPSPTPTPVIKAMTPPAPKASVKASRNSSSPKSVTRIEQPVATSRPEISADTIALRAYFLGQRRQENGLTGDSTTDWLEAEQQLRTESEA